MTVQYQGVYVFCFISFILLFLGSSVLFGFNARNFHRSGNTLVTEAQKNGSRMSILGLVLMVIGLLGFLVTLIAYYQTKPNSSIPLVLRNSSYKK
jgi:Na+/proline symporter